MRDGLLMKQNKKNQPSHWEKLFIQLQRRIYKKKYFIITGSIVLLLIIMFFGFFRMVFFLLLLLLLNIIISFIAKHIPRAHTSIELIMFGTVLSGAVYGMKIGAIFGIISSILYYYAAGRFSYYVAIFAPLYAFIGIAAALFNKIDIFTLGMICTITYTVISSIIVIIAFNAKLDKAIMFGIINTAFNFIMFKYLASIFIAIM
jgi:hypothetical protein